MPLFEGGVKPEAMLAEWRKEFRLSWEPGGV